MTDKYSFLAFFLLVASITALALIGKADNSVVVGLVGVLGTFKPRSAAPDQTQPVTVVQPDDKPVPVETKDV